MSLATSTANRHIPLGLFPRRPASRLYDRVVEVLRTWHYSRRTEKANIHWIRRLVLFHTGRHPRELAEGHVNRFLTHLAVKENVAASTQNQALAALLFLYEHVLEQPLNRFYADRVKQELCRRKTGSYIIRQEEHMRRLAIATVGVVVVLATLVPASVHAEDKRYGKVFIKGATAEVNGREFPDAEIEESVKDMKKRHGKFALAESESEADFMIVIIERRAVAISGQPASKTIAATLSVREGATWKPAAKLQSKARNIFWGLAADNIIDQAENWVKKNALK